MTVHQLIARPARALGNGAIEILEFRGEVDATNAEELAGQLEQTVGGGPVILDLSGAEFFDSAGFAVLDRRLAAGGLFIVVTPGSLIATATRLVGLPVHDSVDAAVTAIGRG